MVVGHPDDAVRIAGNRDGNYPDKGGSSGIRASTLPFVGEGLCTWDAPDAQWRQRRRAFRPLYRAAMCHRLDELDNAPLHGGEMLHVVAREILGDLAQNLLGLRPPFEQVDIATKQLAVLARTFWVGKSPGAKLLTEHRSRVSVGRIEHLIGNWCETAMASDSPIRDRAATIGLGKSEVRDEVAAQLLSVGTTAVPAVWGLYLLALSPRVQDRLRIEMRRPGSNYLAWTVREVLRLCPSTYWIQRRADKEDVVGSRHVPAGTRVVVLVPRVHRHPDFWPRSDDFDPERFANAVPGALRYWMPFGMGSRSCVAREYAMDVVARVLFQLISQYRITTTGRVRAQLVPAFSLLPRPQPEFLFERL